MECKSPDIAILIPCYNEALSIESVISGFQMALPQATIYVYDNNSTDGTAAVARAAGAVVRSESRQGKGHVIRRMFADVEADIYVMVDGDGAHPPEMAVSMVQCLIHSQLDMVIGVRQPSEQHQFRKYHGIGNRMFNSLLARMFGKGMADVFSGYRVLSRRFVKSFPALSRGFEIETEMSVHVLEMHLPFAEMDVPYQSRVEGSHSKLSTFRDGSRILLKMVLLYKEAKPLALFFRLALLFMLLGLALGYPLVITFQQTGLVPRIPTALIVVGLGVFSIISLTAGIILDSVARLRREQQRLAYLRTPWMS